MKALIAKKAFIDGKFVDNVGFTINHGFLERTETLPRDAKVFDVVIPGFIDAHTHLWQYGLFISRPNLKETKSIKDALEFIEAVVKSGNYRPPIIFEEFDQSTWDEKRFITKKELDNVTGDTPVILRRVCGHIAIANSAALKLLPRKTPGVDSKSGLLLEEVPLKINEYFPPEFEEIKLAILTAQEEMINLGITSVHEFGNVTAFRAYEELRDAGLLKIRVYFNFYENDLENLIKLGIRSGFGNTVLRIGGVKIFADGSVGGKTAAFFENYVGEKHSGKLLKTREELENLIKRAQENGIQLLIHAIGTRAIRTSLEAFKNALEGGNYLRHRIEHFEFPEEVDLKLAKSMGILISAQPNFVERWGGENGMYREYLGDRLWKLNNPFKKMLSLGIKVAFGSDAMPPSPQYGLRGALYHPIEPISFEEALRLYTTAGAYFSFEEDLKGALKDDYVADFVVIDRASPEFKIQSVFINGKIASG